jgi:hypothetical protein
VAPPCAGLGSDCSGEVGGAPATGGGRWAIVGAMGGGGSLGWVCSRPEPGARRGCLQWRRRCVVVSAWRYSPVRRLALAGVRAEDWRRTG